MALFQTPWLGHELDERLAGDMLRDIVAHLTRQKWRQQLIEGFGVGLFWGLCAATAAVLLVKLNVPRLALLTVIVPCVATAVIAALVAAWLKRPDRLQVAILADLELRLKQRLSTAWEFADRGADPGLAQRLAVQAVKQRFPPAYQRVFPVRISTWHRLVPLAALLLALVSVLDLAREPAPVVQAVDDLVIEQGRRLREFARQMQVRAAREALPRSSAAAESVQRLGARMETGALSRESALHRLRTLGQALQGERQTALRASGAGSAGSPGQLAGEAISGSDAARLRDLLQQLLHGGLTPGQQDSLAREAGALSRSGISSQALREALDDFVDGDPLELQQIVEVLSRIELALEDAEALGTASERVERARENLGEFIVRADDLVRPGRRTGSEDTDARGLLLRRPSGDAGAVSQAGGHGAGSEPAPRQPARKLSRSSEREDVGLKATGQLRAGDGFATQARVLPRAAPASVATLALDTQFVAQVEEVLATDRYPLHQKEFIRRYFLQLSQGTAAADSTPP